MPTLAIETEQPKKSFINIPEKTLPTDEQHRLLKERVLDLLSTTNQSTFYNIINGVEYLVDITPNGSEENKSKNPIEWLTGDQHLVLNVKLSSYNLQTNMSWQNIILTLDVGADSRIKAAQEPRWMGTSQYADNSSNIDQVRLAFKVLDNCLIPSEVEPTANFLFTPEIIPQQQELKEKYLRGVQKKSPIFYNFLVTTIVDQLKKTKPKDMLPADPRYQLLQQLLPKVQFVKEFGVENLPTQTLGEMGVTFSQEYSQLEGKIKRHFILAMGLAGTLGVDIGVLIFSVYSQLGPQNIEHLLPESLERIFNVVGPGLAVQIILGIISLLYIIGDTMGKRSRIYPIINQIKAELQKRASTSTVKEKIIN
jgi:hypothetical protein